MVITSEAEVENALGLSQIEPRTWFPVGASVASESYRLSSVAAEYTMLAKGLARAILQCGKAWLVITYWHNDLEANQDLFYGYRKGHGETRDLRKPMCMSLRRRNQQRWRASSHWSSIFPGTLELWTGKELS